MSSDTQSTQSTENAGAVLPGVVSTTEEWSEVYQNSKNTILEVLGDNDSNASIAGVAQPENGVVSLSSAGEIVYAPKDGYSGEDTFCYYLRLDENRIVEVTAKINVIPVAVSDYVDVPQDSTGVRIDAIANDTDADGDKITLSGFEQPSHGSVTLNDDGSVNYVPAAGYHGDDSFEYTITDGNGGFSTAVVVIAVKADDTGNQQNTAPTAVDDSASTTVNTAVEIDVTANDTDPDQGDHISLITYTSPPNGTVNQTDDGKFIYTPRDGFVGVDSFTYAIKDENGGDDTANVWITVEATDNSNQNPNAVDDNSTTNANTSIVLKPLENDSDPDGDTLTITEASTDNGTVEIVNGDSINYTPNDGFTGQDTVTYTISDGKGGTDSATIHVNVNADSVNQAPTFTNLPDDGVVNIDENSNLVLDADAVDPENDDLTYSIVGGQDADAFIIDPDTGELSFKDAPDFENPASSSNSNTYDVTIRVSDGENHEDKTIWVNVNDVDETDSGTNANPDAVDDNVTTGESTKIIINALENDSDPDGDDLTITAVSAENGSVEIANGKFVHYTPNDGFIGQDSVTYTISDGNGGTDTATIHVTVNGNSVNQAPNFTNLPDDGVINVNENSSYVLDADAVDPEDDDLIYSIVGGQDADAFIIDPDTGELTFKDSPDFEDPGSANNSNQYDVTIRVSDGENHEDKTLSINVNDINDSNSGGNSNPDAVDDHVGTDENTTIIINALGNDSDPDGDDLTITKVSAENGTVEIANGKFIHYKPNEGFIGQDTISYTISDGNGGTDSAIVYVAVNTDSVNQKPNFTNLPDDGIVFVVENSTFVLDVDAVDPEGESLVYSIVSGQDADSFEIDPDTGELSFKHPPDFENPGSVSNSNTYDVTIRVSDGESFREKTIWVKVTDVDEGDPNSNSNPDAVDDQVTTDENTQIVINALGNDSDPDGDDLTITEVSALNGTVGIANGKFVHYTPNSGFTGNDAVTYTITDGNGGFDTATIIVNVEPTQAANNGPVANKDHSSTDVNQQVIINVLENDTDPDGDKLSVVDYTGAENGTVALNADGTFTYIPNNNFTGSDCFSYVISDGNGGIDVAKVIVQITALNSNADPDAVGDAAVTLAEQSTTINVLENDVDPDGDPLVIFEFSQPANGFVTKNEDGSFLYTPNDNFTGEDSFTYKVTDGHGGFDTAQVVITVQAEGNRAPDAVNDSVELMEDGSIIINPLANDSDPDGDSLTITAANANSGTVEILEDGTIKYTPNANFNGQDVISYSISDGNGGTDSATINVTVTPVNDNPVAKDDIAATDLNTPIIVNALENDHDLDGDNLSITVATALNGVVEILDDGTLKYTPNDGFTGEDSITYGITDGNGGIDSAVVTVHVGTDNTNPVANDDVADVNEDGSVNINALLNDTDADDDNLTIIDATAPNGTVEILDDGTLQFTPDPDFNGVETITYTVSDGNGGTDTATVTVTVNAVNDAPVANDDAAELDEDESVNIDVLANDTDVDGDDLTITDASAPNGTVEILDDGTLQFTPDPDFNGVETITYTISDGNGGTDTATVTVTVNAVNDAPVANDDAAELDEDGSVNIDVLANDTDVDGDDLTITDASAPNGTVEILDDGTLQFMPDPDFNGVETITYTISDGNGGTDSATITVTVNAVNDAPVANDDAADLNEDGSVNIDVLANDADFDGDDLTIIDASAQNGTVEILDDGTLQFTPDPDFNGVETITYTVSDGNGGTDTATVTVTINAVNDAPVANDDAAELDEDGSVNIDVLANDTDLDGDDLTIIDASAPNGTVEILDDGTLQFTPDPDFNGVETITYTISDGNGGTDTATVTVTVNAVNDAPVANDDAAELDEDGSVNIDILANDTDVDGDDLTIIDATAPNGTVEILDDGTLQFTPDTDFNGVETITYTVSDGNGGTDTATVTVTVNAVNDAPVANDDAAELDEDGSVNINVLANDTDLDGDDLTIVDASAPNGTVEILDDGTLQFTPDPDFNGVETITYTISDGNGGTDTATVTVTVNAVNDAPVANDDAAELDEDGSVNIDVLANDTDVDGDDLTITDASAPNGTVEILDDGTLQFTPDPDFNGVETITYTISDGNGGNDTATVTVTINAGNDAPVANDDAAELDEDGSVNINVLANDTDLDGDDLTVTDASAPNGTVEILDDGTLQFTPDPDFNGVETITYTISDGNGGTDTATVTVTVNAVNDAPVANDDAAELDEDGSVNIDVLANDADFDGDDLTIIDASAPNGTVEILDDGTLQFTPDPDFNGVETITYTISDGNGGTDTATVTVTVNAVNDAPVANDDAADLDEDGSVNIDVLANDADFDGDDLTIIDASAPNGTVEILDDGTLQFTPDPDFNGVETITYTISDGNGGTDTATVTVTVNAVNDAPVANDDAAQLDEDGSVNIDVLTNDADLDGDDLTVTDASAPNGTVEILDDGTLQFTPDPDFNGVETITYTISDGNGGTDTATVTVTVNAVNDAPVANDDAAQLDEDGSVNIDVLTNDADLDGDDLTVTDASAPNGTVEILDDGTLQFTPDPDFNGVETITYTISDGNGGTDTATVTVTVNAVNDAPVANDDTAEVDEDGSVNIDVLANDTDVDGDDLIIIDASSPNGTVEILDDGTLQFTPDPDFNGVETITYTISDGNGGTDTATITVQVNSINDGPKFTNVPADCVINIDENATFVKDLDASDLEGDDLVYSIVGGADSSKFTIDPETGVLSFITAPDFEAPADHDGNNVYRVKVSVSDGEDSVSKLLKVKVNDVDENTAPEAKDDFATTDEGEAVTISVLGNDSDADNDTLSITDFEQPSNGTVVLNSNGTFTYLPKPGFSGNDSFTYEISDGNGGTDTATAFITIEENGPAVCAKLVGDSTIAEGSSGSYKIVLDAPLDHDSWFQLQVNDGSAHRVDHAASNQDIMWGGYYDSRYGIGGAVAEVFYNKIPNGPTLAYGNRDATGPSDASWDFSLYQNNCLIQGNTVYVKIPAGETSSNSLDIAAWKEKVTVDNDAGNSAGHDEGYETFEVEIVGSHNADGVEICDDDIQVSIQDRTEYYKVSPIAIDLNRDNIIGVTGETSSVDKEGVDEIGKTVNFDIDGDGDKDTIEWFDGSGDGILIDNRDGNAANDMDGTRLFGDQGGKYNSGYDKLSEFDVDGDGNISGDEMEGLGVWIDDGDAVVEAGEIASLFDVGISSLSAEMQENQGSDGRMLMQSSATTTDGEKILTEDVWFLSAEDSGITEDEISMDEVLSTLPEDDGVEADHGNTAISADSGSRELSYDSGNKDAMDELKKLYDDQSDQGNDF